VYEGIAVRRSASRSGARGWADPRQRATPNVRMTTAALELTGVARGLHAVEREERRHL
jgi:hypothetical protein